MVSVSIREKLESERQDLLDLSLRNTLLNHRELKGRGARIVDERSEQVFRLLVEEEKAMSFLSTPEDAEPEDGDDEDATFEQPEEEESSGPAARHVDLKLQTPYDDKQLQRRLLNTFYYARTFIQERGVNTLYLALGELRWYEDRSSDKERRAPLVLVPVELDRANVKSRFRISYNGADFGSNHSLEVKLKLDFSVELPEFSLDAESDLLTYFEAVARRCENLERWSVEPHAIHLGFYSFLKLLMYEDLDPESWPEDQKPYENPLLGRVMELGFQGDGLAVAKDAPLDPLYDPASSFQVVDADSSQTSAIENALSGSDLVIEGPPGTGKSQTISNLIAEAVGRGKTVLFVAEKLAALDVVHRRLEAIDLGDLCLELHGHRTRKKEVLRELERTLNLGRPLAEDRGLAVASVTATRSTLNGYADAVNDPIENTGVTPIEAYGHLDRLASEDTTALQEIASPQLVEWGREKFESLLAKVRQLESLLERMGSPRAHPFWGSRSDTYIPTRDDTRVRGGAQALRDSIAGLAESGGDLAAILSAAVPQDLAAAERLIHYAETVLRAPNLERVDVDAAAWSGRADHVDQALKLGAEISSTRRHYDELLPHAWEESGLLPVRNAVAVYGSKWWRFFSSEYRQAKKRLMTLWDGSVPKSAEEQLAALDAILAVHRSRADLETLRGLLEDLYGGVPGEESDHDWRSFREVFEYLTSVHREVARRSLPEQALGVLAGPLDRELLERRLDEARDAWAEVELDLEQVRRVVMMPHPADSTEGVLSGSSFDDLRTKLGTWITEPGKLRDMATFNTYSRALEEEGLDGLVQYSANWDPAEPGLEDLVLIARYTLLVEKAFETRVALRQFDGSIHDATVKRFREADHGLLHANRFAVLEKHWKGLPTKAGVGQMGALLHEMQKRVRHKSIRQLMQLSGRAIQAIKPVFMMSPLSIPAYVPPGSVTFDLVIFDEASQVRPVDAFGALLRGHQAVVVGDSKQLPPTAFFNRMVDGEDEEWDQSTAELESILKAFIAKGAPSVMLQWHYRSRHESLIQLSNQEFYEGDLKIFPSPDAQREGRGLVFHHLPETHYQSGKGRGFNRGEAKAVARAVMDHGRNRPERTLGVAAFSKAQSDVILDELEALRREDSSLEGFFSQHPEEPFFVKNLENVQGDERDVIFISVGYGRTEDGSLSMNFGPLNHVGGERRLNVLVTRARLRCEVFSNLTSHDIDLRRTSARGVEAFKKYLRFAEVGVLDEKSSRTPSRDPVFETQVARALQAEGFEVRQGVGSVGFQVDLAVLDPARPGRYLLGIECDGDGYRSARWARDRDRIRPAVLNGLGWSMHRIWSTDWFRNKAAEVRAVLEAIETAKAEVLPLTETSSHDFTVTRAEKPDVESEPALQFPAYAEATLRIRLGGLELHQMASGQIAEWVDHVVGVEGPIHQSELCRRIARAAGKQQTGSRIQAAVRGGLVAAERAGQVRVDKDDFVWPAAMEEPAPRDRSELHDASRKFELISGREVEVAVLNLVDRAFGVHQEEVAPVVCRALGFARTSRAMAKQVDQAIESLLEKGELLADGASLSVSSEAKATL